jgi:formylglycine-generating enzyme required for sulfatase activity
MKTRLLLCWILLMAILPNLRADNDRFTNSLGMIFVNVPKCPVSFCIWETRIQDYAPFVREGQWGHLWPRKPGFQQASNHPVVNVSWDDAKAFCIWLTTRDQKLGLLNTNQIYRLPTDREWSAAVGLTNEFGRTPQQRMYSPSEFPWGHYDTGPMNKGSQVHILPNNAGNYGGSDDGFKFTAPVGSFLPNKFGIYDLGGNAWEWCVDFADDGRRHILRGGSWFGSPVASGTRDYTLPDGEVGDTGFRCVLASEPSAPD